MNELQNNSIQKINYEEMVLKFKSFILTNKDNLFNSNFKDYFNTELGIDFNTYLQSNEPWMVFELLDTFENVFNKSVSSDQSLDLGQLKWILDDIQGTYFIKIRNRNLELFKDINIKIEVIAKKILTLFESSDQEKKSFYEIFLNIIELFNVELREYLDILIRSARTPCKPGEKRPSIDTVITDIENLLRKMDINEQTTSSSVITFIRFYLQEIRAYYRFLVRYEGLAKKRELIAQKSRSQIQQLYNVDTISQFDTIIINISHALVVIINETLGEDLNILLKETVATILQNKEEVFNSEDQSKNSQLDHSLSLQEPRQLNIYAWLDNLRDYLLIMNGNEEKEKALFQKTGINIEFIYKELFTNIRIEYKDRIEAMINTISNQ